MDAWHDADDEPQRKKPKQVNEAQLEKDVFGAEDASDDDKREVEEDAAAWRDDDEELKVDLRSAARLRKLRRTPKDRILKGNQLEERLRARYASTRGPQDWVSQSAPNALRDAAQDSEDDDDGDLRVARETDVNVRAPSKSAISAVAFHCASDLLLTGGLDKTLRFFRVDGEINGEAGACHFADLPVRGCAWRAQTDVCIATGRRPFYYSYDVASETATKVRLPPQSKDKSLERSALSSDGAALAFTGHDGRILLADASRGQWRSAEMKCSGTARAVCFSADGAKLYASGGDARIHVWDLRSSKCLATWADAGASPTSSLMCCGQRLLVGSESGIVNLYNSQVQPALSFDAVRAPTVERAVSSLITPISTLACSETLALIASKWARDAMRIVRLGSAVKVVPNWPTAKTPLRYVTAAAFSTEGDLLAVGNDRGKVLLYRLRNP
jgi:U3 small nucleolar RNA-associated protein 18